jgi:ketol-acid reductoisomerase
MYSEADVDTSILGDRQVTILGYGSQGRAHALNLKDSGFNVVVGLRKSGASWAKAEADGLSVQEPNDAVKGAAIVMFLTPDMVQKTLYQSVVDDIEKGALLLFALGFAFHYGQVEA